MPRLYWTLLLSMGCGAGLVHAIAPEFTALSTHYPQLGQRPYRRYQRQLVTIKSTCRGLAQTISQLLQINAPEPKKMFDNARRVQHPGRMAAPRECRLWLLLEVGRAFMD